MEYEIRGTVMQAVELVIGPGESVITESGGMSWMSPNFKMDTNMPGGILGGLKRAISGESVFLTKYSCEKGEGRISFAASAPGNIIPIKLGPEDRIICQKNAFLCAQGSVELNIHFRKRLSTGLFGGEGFILQELSGPGLAFLELDGEIVEKELAAGETLLVDSGHIGAFEPSVQFDVEIVRGLRNFLFGGEYFLASLKGPGKVWLQTMPVVNLAARLIPFLPHSDKN